MSGPIKRFDVTIEWGNGYAEQKSEGSWVDYADHLASHALDEAKERELFEADFSKLYDLELNPITEEYENPDDQALWLGWLRCAKSRAKAAGCE